MDRICLVMRMPALHLDRFARLGLNDFDLGITDVNLLLKPVAGIFIAMAQQNHPRGNLADKIQQVGTVGVRG